MPFFLLSFFPPSLELLPRFFFLFVFLCLFLFCRVRFSVLDGVKCFSIYLFFINEKYLLRVLRVLRVLCILQEFSYFYVERSSTSNIKIDNLSVCCVDCMYCVCCTDYICCTSFRMQSIMMCRLCLLHVLHVWQHVLRMCHVRVLHELRTNKQIRSKSKINGYALVLTCVNYACLVPSCVIFKITYSHVPHSFFVLIHILY